MINKNILQKNSCPTFQVDQKYRSLKEARIFSVTVHANPLADWVVINDSSKINRKFNENILPK